MSQSLRLRAAAATRTAPGRSENQDAHLVLEERGLVVVADGVGGNQGGALAAELAVKAVSDFASTMGTTPREALDTGLDLLAAFYTANTTVRSAARERGYADMATTLTAARVIAGRVWLAHVGDSRAFLLRERRLYRLTTDHSLRSDPKARMVPTPDRGIRPDLLTRAIGMSQKLDPELHSEPVFSGDTILVASDGLTSAVSEEQIAQVLLLHPTPRMAAAALIQRAGELGAWDDVTAAVGIVVAWD